MSIWSHKPLRLTAFINLKQLNVEEVLITTCECQIIFANNPTLESLDYNTYYYPNGLIEKLTVLPQLKSLGLPPLPPSFH